MAEHDVQGYEELQRKYEQLLASHEAIHGELERLKESSNRVRFETAQRVARFYSKNRFELIDTPVPNLGDTVSEPILLTSELCLADVRERIDDLAASIRMTSERREDLRLAACELATNAYFHGGGRVEFYLASTMVATRVSDVGAGMNFEEAIDCIFGEYHSTRGTLGIGWPIVLQLEIDHTWLCIKGSEDQGVVCQLQQYDSRQSFDLATHKGRKNELERLLRL